MRGGTTDRRGNLGSPSYGASRIFPIASDAPVAQLDRALASGARGYGFDPRRARFFSRVQCWEYGFDTGSGSNPRKGSGGNCEFPPTRSIRCKEGETREEPRMLPMTKLDMWGDDR